jgi:putative tryptophan/tyrosine transport system substrate-binding protein
MPHSDRARRRGVRIARRDFIASIGGAAVSWPLAARSQQPLPVIGFLTSYSPAVGLQRLAPLEQGLAEVGFVAGKNVAIEARWAEGHYDRLPAMAADLVLRQVRVIVASNEPSALAAKAATPTIPIVFGLTSDPVALGLVASLARPGGNLTGATRQNVGPKRLQLMHEMVPSATSMALLVNPANPAVAERERSEIKAAASTLGLELHVLEASDESGVEKAFATALQLRAGGLVIGTDAFFSDQVSLLGTLSLRHRIPTIYYNRNFVAAGNLMSYAGSLSDTYRIVGNYTGRILKGEKPADLPVQQSTKFELFINLKTAKALGSHNSHRPPRRRRRGDRVRLQSKILPQCTGVRLGAGFSDVGWRHGCGGLGPTSEKRPGTKSRGMGHCRCRGLYGDLSAAAGSEARLDAGARDHRRRRIAAREVAGRHLRHSTGPRERSNRHSSAVAGRAGSLPAASQRIRSADLVSIGAAGFMTCRF